jgi:Zn finger protein HypA/HybF involved in hydrogenase expression
MEEHIHQAQIALCLDIIARNTQKEKALLKMDEKDESLFCVSIDGGWNNKGFAAKTTTQIPVITSL